MPFKKGQKKIGGREKGSTNKDTEFKQAIKEGVKIEDILSKIAEMDKPTDQVDRMIKLLEFAYPKMKSIEHSGDGNTGFVLTIKEVGDE